MLNPPAFPLSDTQIPYHHEGMSLLDYFAGQVAAGRAVTNGQINDYHKFAKQSYDIAEIMLEERAIRLQAQADLELSREGIR